MSQPTEYIEHLVYKFNTGNITPDELQILTDWYNSHDDESAVIPSQHNESFQEVKSRMLSTLLAKLADEQPKSKKLYPQLKWIAAAAAVLLIAMSIWMVQQNEKPGQKTEVVKTAVEPGGNKATLTLANGKKIALSSSQPGIITDDKITYSNGMPVEDAAVNQSDNGNQLISLETPRGGTYSIILQDGTKVWLNAASTLKYPIKFDPKERVVELQGEAYFQVKSIYKNSGEKVPFKVISKGQQVEVLGTQFNMSAYPEQVAVKTTLVEGKVAVSDQQNRFILMPNQQAVTLSGKTQIKNVNVNNFTAWRDGKFSFDGKTFEETMNEIGRWYDLDIIYENGIPSEELVGDAFRNQKISLVLRLLNVAQINYKLNTTNRTLTITGNK
ncbi:FecR family protein [Pedobacter sp.]|uniref:FecR family protein n=1 Tax=Pedobacter sp. TaxID=1411316 RepID=UPI003D7F9B70